MRIAFLVAMMMVALSSNPLIHKESTTKPQPTNTPQPAASKTANWWEKVNAGSDRRPAGPRQLTPELAWSMGIL